MTEKSLYFVAGEPSGDAIGGKVLAALRAAEPSLTIHGVGGPAMAREGLDSLFPISDIAVMGLAEVLPHLRVILRRLRQTEQDIVARKPAAVVTIDAPGFCFRLARRLRARLGPEIRLIHVVAPTVWAWKPRRARKIAAIYDRLLALLPFEPPYFEREGLPTDFIGHPVILNRPEPGTGARFREARGIAADETVLSVLPGSRIGEIKRLLPIFQEVVDRLSSQGRVLRAAIPVVPHLRGSIEAAVGGWETPPILVGQADKHACFAASDLALAASGTVSLELAMADVPMVIGYRLNPMTTAIVRRMVKVKYASLINLVLDRPVIPEFLLGDCTPERLCAGLETVLDSPSAGPEMRAGYHEALTALGLGRLDPGESAAEAVLRAIR